MEISIFVPILLIILIALVIGIFLHTEREKERIRRKESEVMSITTHQLRTPIAVLRGYISLVLDEGYGHVPEELKHPLQVLLHSSEQLGMLVEEYRELRSVDGGELSLRCEEVDFSNYIREIVEELQPEIQRRKHTLRASIPDALGNCCIDAGKVKQVMMNIIENALEYTPEGTHISIDVEKQNSQLIIDISDSGPGIAEDEKELIFDKYIRGRAGQEKGRGTGLGLFIARTIIRSHGGNIWVTRSKKYGGALFRIEVPIG